MATLYVEVYKKAPAMPGPVEPQCSIFTVSAQRMPYCPSFNSAGRIRWRRDRGRLYSGGERRARSEIAPPPGELRVVCP